MIGELRPASEVGDDRPAPLLITGPTASGKSELAARVGEVVINADSQQVYADWQILTARPEPEEVAQRPHKLYGHVGLDETYSVGRWVREVAAALAEAQAAGRRVVIVGGTGLYFKALTVGLVDLPETPRELRALAEAELERLGLAGFAAALAERDPQTLAQIDRSNPMRLLRAFEVLEMTGDGLAAWQQRTAPPLLPLAKTVPIALMPPRDWLYARCEARFDRMIARGALDEVRAVMALGPPPEAPGLKAVGAPELMAHLRGETDLETAIAAGKTATRRYAKRQLTWIRNQMSAWRKIPVPLDPSALAGLVNGLTQNSP
ncbi:MAG: tRNA (adenosine(37)-N6)-dimethylallyltransferase MiaA [Pikeienuella sp.]